MSVATELGKEYALAELTNRRANRPKQIDNSSLYAGSPMYFYCYSCGWLSDTKPESYRSIPSHTCKECQALKDLGWLEV